MPSSRPAPLTLGAPFRAVNSPTTSPSSETSDRTFSSDLYLLSATSTLSPSSSYSGTTITGGSDRRKASSGCHSNSSYSSKRKVNANSYCGRHSDEFLFGGHGLGDLWRSLKNGKKE